MSRAQPVVAIDGPAGSGKSTIARQVARRLGFTLVDTGAIYRCLALAAMRCGIDWSDGSALGELAGRLEVRFERGGLGERVWLADEEIGAAIRTPELSRGASLVSAHPQVRAALLETQRRLGRAGGVVLEGRDIGTVVFPDAEVKVFLSATPEVRARRRHLEHQARGSAGSFEQTLAEVVERDERDSSRAVAPLRPAAEALIIDTSGLSIDQVVERVADLVAAHLSGLSGEG